MCLLTQNMKLDVLNNGGERISNCIMCGYAFSTMCIMKQMYPCQIYGLATYASRKATSHGMGEAQSSA